MNNCSEQSIKEVHESNEDTIQLDNNKQPRLLALGHQKKLTLVRKVYSERKAYLKKKILLDWPNQTLRPVLQGCDLITLRNNGYYIGQVANNVIHGKGLAIYSLDRFYEGDFQNNCKHGQGIENLQTGTYVGSFVNNKPEGKGEFISRQGDTYEGEFRAGMKHGKGVWTSLKYSYTGQWKANKPNGIGKVKTIKSEYEGTVVEGASHGRGREVFANGDVYSGSYFNGRLQGQGVYVWNSLNSVYKGTFKNGLRHGIGAWSQNGDTYKGQFSNDKKNGFGKFIWASGNQYQGLFFEDMMHGNGRMSWTDGSWYEGNWLYGVQNGYGQIQQCGQPIVKGMFENNRLIGQQRRNSHILPKKTKLQRLRQRERRKQGFGQVQQKSFQGKRCAKMGQFETDSQNSKKALASRNSSILFRTHKLPPRRVRTFQSEQARSLSVDAHLSTCSEELKLIDWRGMKAVNPS